MDTKQGSQDETPSQPAGQPAAVRSRLGSSFQQKDSRLFGYRPQWLSPDRDLAIMWPTYLIKALQLAENDILSRQSSPKVTPQECPELSQLYCYARRVTDFDKRCVGPDSPKSVHTLALATQILDPELAGAEALVGKYLLRVMQGAYFKGVRFATMKGESPVYREDLDAMVEEWVGKLQP